MDKLKIILYKINISAIYFLLLLGVCYLIFGVPIVGYNNIVQSRAEKCFKENFSNYESEYAKERNYSDNNYVEPEYQQMGKPIFLFSRNGIFKGPNTTRAKLQEICNIRYIFGHRPSTPDFRIEITSGAIIADTTNISTPLWIAAMCFAFALLLFLLGKWLSWVFKVAS